MTASMWWSSGWFSSDSEAYPPVLNCSLILVSINSTQGHLRSQLFSTPAWLPVLLLVTSAACVARAPYCFSLLLYLTIEHLPEVSVTTVDLWDWTVWSLYLRYLFLAFTHPWCFFKKLIGVRKISQLLRALLLQRTWVQFPIQLPGTPVLEN